ncbi:helix-turn-helix domain-containing protein [Shewanella frigidimarina]|uniref:helix-turn-helix domain-containing protein n=1 Tax=Shewanella frigidimarina TaxID=56812 RepID=UPI003D79C228
MMSTDYKNKMLDLPTRKQAGRKKKLTPEQVNEIKNIYATGEYTLKTLGDHYNVSHTTINKQVK